jgi:hypothetical protein
MAEPYVAAADARIDIDGAMLLPSMVWAAILPPWNNVAHEACCVRRRRNSRVTAGSHVQAAPF